MAIVFVIMLLWVIPTGGFSTIPAQFWSVIMISGMVGMFVGDTALFTAMARLGPRRTGVSFATNAPMTVITAWLWLGETLTVHEILGCLLVSGGVCLATFLRSEEAGQHHLEQVQGTLWVGITLGLTGAFCQDIGALMTKPALLAGADLVALSAVRSGVAAAALYLCLLLPIEAQRAKQPMTISVLGRTILAGILGMALGMSLLLYAYGAGDAGVAATLSSTSPVLVLPILWLITRRLPSVGAWAGAPLCVGGTAMILGNI